jgi:predicted PurR-regulated permease PerM
MSNLIAILICFFLFLIVYQLFLAYFNPIIEGIENQTYQDYDKNNDDNIRILTQQNSGNIEVLKQRIDEVMGLNKEVHDLSGNVATLQSQVDGLLQANIDAASAYPTTPPDGSGLDTDTTTEIVETDVAVTE